MRFGYDEHKVKINPTYSGQRATCPFCKGLLIGKCGDIYVWHWQHQQDRQCDPWQEHETDWHRNWKDNFPDNWQEVIMEVGLEKHIADVRTSKGIVIELQNSPISTSTIKIRENFYKNMIWIVNAEPFKDSFHLTSVVKIGLRRLDEDSKYKYDSIQDAYSYENKSLRQEIDKNSEEISEKIDRIKSNEKKIDILIDKQKNFDGFIDEVISRWSKGRLFHDSVVVSERIGSSYIKPLEELSKEINKLKVEIDNLESGLQYINDREDFEFGGKQLKIVDRLRISTKSFQKVKVVSKATRRNIFPEVMEFNSELEFANFMASYRFNKEDFDFAFDVEEKVLGLNSAIANKRDSATTLASSFLLLKEEVKSSISQVLELLVREINEGIEKLNIEWEELILESNRLTLKQEELKVEEQEYIAASLINLGKDTQDKRHLIMRNNKGRYFFEWKHERKSWKAANCSVFFDTGEDFLFERTANDVFKKTLIRAFLADHLGLLKGIP